MTDAVVIGAGWDGLAAAVALARGGRRVTVVERRDAPGGNAALEEVAPGHRVPGIQHGTTGLRPRVAEALGLFAHGLAWRERPPLVHVPPAAPGEPALRLRQGADEEPDGLSARAPGDVAAWREWRALLGAARELAGRLVDAAPPPLRPGARDLLALGKLGWLARRLPARVLHECLRAAPQAVRDHLDERFRDPLLQACLASRGIEGGFLGPRSAGSAALLLARECGAGKGVGGGPVAVTEALVGAARAAGVELVLGRAVASVAVEGGRVRGVELAGGDALDARAVVSTAGARATLCELVPHAALPQATREAARAVRARGTTAALRLALSSPPRWLGAPDGGAPVELVRAVDTLDGLERAFDDVKHDRPCASPWLDVAVVSAERADLAPPGRATLSILVHCAAPLARGGGWTEDVRARFRERVLERLERAAPGVRDTVVGHELLAPSDLALRYALDGGHPSQADLGLDQLLVQRPTALLSRYRTPVEGLFLGGRASHPGGDFPGTAGLLAAEAALAAT